MPIRAGRARAASCTVPTLSFPMATPNSLTPCSAPHSQVGHERSAACAPVSPMERYCVRREQPAVGRRRKGTVSWTSPTGRSEFLAKTIPPAPGAHRVSHMPRAYGGLSRVRLMDPRHALTFDQIDLSDIAFWARPWEEREGAFLLLRREHPLAFFEEPAVPGKLAHLLPRGPGYRAVTRHAHIAEVSRHPEIYR